MEDASELLQAMQTEKDFPWKEMGEYQNLAALISMVVNQESPMKNMKVRILSDPGRACHEIGFPIDLFNANVPVCSKY